MTTIATDGVSIAADGRTTAGDRIVDDKSRKLHRMPDGSIVGQSGRVSHAQEAIAELEASIRDGRAPKYMKGDYTLLRLHQGGAVTTYDSELVPLDTPTPAAAGTGASYALGAMLAGACSQAAIRIAKKLDVNSGGRVVTMQPKEPK